MLIFFFISSAKLAALFGSPSLAKSKTTTNETLTYTPPKQPKATTDSPAVKPKPQTAVLCAKAVTLYKRLVLLVVTYIYEQQINLSMSKLVFNLIRFKQIKKSIIIYNKNGN